MLSLSAVDIFVLSILIAIFIGFSFGHNRGRKQGYQEGEIELLFRLREESLTVGKCAICDDKEDSEHSISKQFTIEKDEG